MNFYGEYQEPPYISIIIHNSQILYLYTFCELSEIMLRTLYVCVLVFKYCVALSSNIGSHNLIEILAETDDEKAVRTTNLTTGSGGPPPHSQVAKAALTNNVDKKEMFNTCHLVTGHQLLLTVTTRWRATSPTSPTGAPSPPPPPGVPYRASPSQTYSGGVGSLLQYYQYTVRHDGLADCPVTQHE